MQTTGTSFVICRCVCVCQLPIQKFRARVEVSVDSNRPASSVEFSNCALQTSELFVILRLDVATMVLVEVVQLVVNVNWRFNCFVNLQCK